MYACANYETETLRFENLPKAWLLSPTLEFMNRIRKIGVLAILIAIFSPRWEFLQP